MAKINEDGSVQPDESLGASSDEAVIAAAREKFVERARSVRWTGSPHWAWKYIVEDVFGQTRAYWASEDETDKVRTEPAFEVEPGERVVIRLDWT